MKSDQITSKLREFVQHRFSIPENDPDFSDEIDLFNYGYVDSIGAVELTGFVAREFGVKFADSDWLNFPLSSIRAISAFVAQRCEVEG
jgi:acyl carrier protein